MRAKQGWKVTTHNRYSTGYAGSPVEYPCDKWVNKPNGKMFGPLAVFNSLEAARLFADTENCMVLACWYIPWRGKRALWTHSTIMEEYMFPRGTALARSVKALE